jgi:hypothetical protein
MNTLKNKKLCLSKQFCLIILQISYKDENVWFKTFCQRSWKFWFVFDEFFDLEIPEKILKNRVGIQAKLFAFVVTVDNNNRKKINSESNDDDVHDVDDDDAVAMKWKIRGQSCWKDFQDLSPFDSLDEKSCISIQCSWFPKILITFEPLINI